MGKKKQRRQQPQPPSPPPPPSSEEKQPAASTTTKKQKSKKQLEREEQKDVGKYLNKQRTLVFSARGISNRDRHLMQDLRDLLPHAKKDVKMDTKLGLHVVNEIADMKNCNNCIFFESRKKQDLYMWVARCPNGPSIKFLVENVHTMAEVKLTGNCLKGSRPVLAFDASFDARPELALMKELLNQTLGTPKGYPRAKPFVDHVFLFSVLDNRIWFRNYQIMFDIDGNVGTEDSNEPVLVEIGPRLVLNPIKIFSGSFSGATLWKNPAYVTPNASRSNMKRKSYDNRKDSEQERAKKLQQAELPHDEVAGVFE